MPAYIEDLNDWQVDEWPTTPEGEERQAKEWEEMYRILFADPNIKAITGWDFADGAWLNAPSGLVTVDNRTFTRTITILSTVNGTDIVKFFRNGTQYYATFKDAEGNYLGYVPNSFDDNNIIYYGDAYTALDEILGGTWFILLGSTIAFLVSAGINNFLNWSIGKAFLHNPDGKLAFAMQSYISTFIGQFCDNLIFSIIVFVVFAPIFWDGFHWTLLQCTTCAFTGAVAELIMEVLFSPVGYGIVKKWKQHHVGQEYLDYIAVRK